MWTVENAVMTTWVSVAILALVLQRVAVAVAGWFTGGYLAVRFAVAWGWQGESTLWMSFIIGAVIAAIVVSLLFDWALIVRRAMEGGTPRRGARDSRPLDGRRKVIE